MLDTDQHRSSSPRQYRESPPMMNSRYRTSSPIGSILTNHRAQSPAELGKSHRLDTIEDDDEEDAVETLKKVRELVLRKSQ